MKTLNTLRAASIATLALGAVSLPTLAQAADYNRYYDPAAECRADENDARLAGGIIGAVVGGVVGSQVAGNGARTEGSAIGAVVGGLAGAGIGDESVDCNKRRREGYTGTTYGVTTPAVYRDGGNYRTVDHRYDRNYRDNNYGYSNHGQWQKERRKLQKRLRKVEKRKYRVKRELHELHLDKPYMSRRQFKQIRRELSAELDQLNYRERSIRRKLGYRHAGYRY